MTAGREDGTAGPQGQLRTSHADRDQAINVLKAAFVQGQLTKQEFDLRVGQVLASRTYADLRALTADLPGWVTSAPEAHEPARTPGRALSFKTAARVGAVGAVPSMVSALVAMTQSSAVPAVVGGFVVALTGALVTVLLTALLVVLSWVVRRSQRAPEQRPPTGRPGLASKRPASSRQLPSSRDPWQAEAVGAA